ncbi:MAG: hypothetical protein WAT19_09865 [Ferruginibacter sp.]
MRNLLYLLLLILFISCNNKKAPDVSNIKIDLKTERFDQDFFKIDSNQVAAQLDPVIAKYPSFGENFLTTILNMDPRWQGDTAANYVKGFLNAYYPVYDTAQKVFKDFSPYEKEIKQGLQYVKHYFPNYKTPSKIITYIGPLDGYGDILDTDALIIGLQHHLGKDYSMYKQEWVRQTYPDYISNRFTPGHIAANSMKNIVLDMFPEKNEDKSLLIQMVEKGKRLYVLQQLLPQTDEYKLIGYTEKQLKDSYAHEASIWNLFVQNNFLQTLDYNIIKNYIGESPKTQELGEASPGNIGSFAGWQIVKKYMDKNPDTKLDQLITLDAEQLFNAAKYKP